MAESRKDARTTLQKGRLAVFVQPMRADSGTERRILWCPELAI